MSSSRDVIYTYDGTFDGLLCCVYEHYYNKTNPIQITLHDEVNPSFFEIYYIQTNNEKAQRVYISIKEKVSLDAQNLVKIAFLSCLKDKEIAIFNFLKFAYKNGAKTTKLLSQPEVSTLLDAQRHLFNEAHNLKGFVRFSDYDGALVSQISPKNYILPFIKHHFCTRFANENFLIYDKTHKCALLYKEHKAQIININALQLPNVTHTEQNYRALWRHFYDTIAIKARQNPRCRMSHMPKRYWENMTELQTINAIENI